MRSLKEIVVSLYYLPATIRTMWKVMNGRYFAFRNEDQSFLEYVWWALNGEESSELDEWHEECINEICARKRLGEWK